ncbi:MAG TPA: prephenate dehydrogenase dimerization domain-containing protein, partial [Fimbriimonas sp.]|nr:prephenate dehydrogenase dimerization domain-containing protein [Fimbriimonas sp.]
ATQTVEKLVKAMGAMPIRIPPEVHDRHVAILSHLPHAIAAALVEMAAQLDHVEVGAGSWRDLTRVGGVDPNLWTQILMGNRVELSKVLSEFEGRLAELRQTLDSEDRPALLDMLKKAQSAKAKQETAMKVEQKRVLPKPGSRRR